MVNTQEASTSTNVDKQSEVNSFETSPCSSSKNSPSYDELYNAFVELHEELKKLARVNVDRKRIILLHEKKIQDMQKELDELKLENETLYLIYSCASCACSTKVIETTMCKNCQTLDDENFVLKNKMAKFTYSHQNLDSLLASSRNVIYSTKDILGITSGSCVLKNLDNNFVSVSEHPVAENSASEHFVSVHSEYSDFVHSVAFPDFDHSVHYENMAQPPTPPGPRERTLRELAAPDFTYDSLSIIDAASGGALGDMTPFEARCLIEKMASNSQQFNARSGDAIVVRGVHNVATNAARQDKLETKIDSLTTLITQLAIN
ncbi:hypothetical protein Lal_00026338 [Lupinus albus]|nr:hypothetical protein Lal_00026338 [Lupinus albus]